MLPLPVRDFKRERALQSDLWGTDGLHSNGTKGGQHCCTNQPPKRFGRKDGRQRELLRIRPVGTWGDPGNLALQAARQRGPAGSPLPPLVGKRTARGCENRKTIRKYCMPHASSPTRAPALPHPKGIRGGDSPVAFHHIGSATRRPVWAMLVRIDEFEQRQPANPTAAFTRVTQTACGANSEAK